MEAKYKVKGMSCGGCVASVTRALQLAIPGVEIVVSLEQGTAKVTGDHDEETARQAIEDAGYDYGGQVH
jgi:copper chaperone